jgi:hypothetical protein
MRDGNIISVLYDFSIHSPKSIGNVSQMFHTLKSHLTFMKGSWVQVINRPSNDKALFCGWTPPLYPIELLQAKSRTRVTVDEYKPENVA